jgi:hypothetical protein
MGTGRAAVPCQPAAMSRHGSVRTASADLVAGAAGEWGSNVVTAAVPS